MKVVKSIFCPVERSGGAHVVSQSDQVRDRGPAQEAFYACSCGHRWWRLLVPKKPGLLRFAAEVCREYEEDLKLQITLRQLYYQGVSRGVLPSGQDAYNALKDNISAARLAGEFPLHALVDRTRYVNKGAFTRCDTKLERALSRAASATIAAPDTYLHRDPWFGQPNHVSVWFEKEALAGIFEDVCNKLGVNWFSTRGEPSQPAIFQWIRRAAEAHGVDNPDGWKAEPPPGRAGEDNHVGRAQRSVVLYFGDHDPTGIRIPRTAEATVGTFMDILRLNFPVEFRRIGISLEQARALNLPPFPAKQSAGKDYDRYVEEFETTDAWELDALEPRELTRLVQKAIEPLFDGELHAKLQRDVEARRAQMRAQMVLPAWHAAATDFHGDD